MRISSYASRLVFGVGVLLAACAASAQSVPLKKEVPRAVSASFDLGRTNSERPLHLTISLNPSDPEGLKHYADGVSDPTNPNYRKFLTPEQVCSMFGPKERAIKAVLAYLENRGMQITGVARHGLAIFATSSVHSAEKAFGTEIHDFCGPDLRPLHKGMSYQYYSYTSNPVVPAEIAGVVQNVSGLENYSRPMSLDLLTPSTTQTLYNSAPLTNLGNLGQGRTVGISNWDGYQLSNLPLFYTMFNLAAPTSGVGSNVSVVPLNGGNSGAFPMAEGDLDIQMVLSAAPLANVVIYDNGAPDLVGTLAQEASDNVCDIITESYGWNLDTATMISAHNIHLTMSAEGITYVAASGDYGTNLHGYVYPDIDPEVLVIGGTAAALTSSGTRSGEVGWSGSGGGWSTTNVPFNTLPTYQTRTSIPGLPTNLNYRLYPDVALVASGSGNANTGAYEFFYFGQLQNRYCGTSFSSPTFAGNLALVEQYAISNGGLKANSNGNQRFGRIQDILYGQKMRPDVWYDVTSGSNGNLPNGKASNAGIGWDFVTGLGAMDFNAFASTQLSGSTPNPVLTAPSAPTGLNAPARIGALFVNWVASAGATSYTLLRGTASGKETPYVTTVAPYYIDKAASHAVNYYYKVIANSSKGSSPVSAEARGLLPAIPPVPASLIATAGVTQISLSWRASSGADAYIVQRSNGSGTEQAFALVTSTSFVDQSAIAGVPYYYNVFARNQGGSSAPSNEAYAIAKLDPQGPSAPVLTAATAPPNISLTWTTSTSPSKLNVSYLLWCSPTQNGNFMMIDWTPTPSALVQFMGTETSAYFFVCAVDSKGHTSPASSIVYGSTK